MVELLYVGVFFGVNDNAEVDLINSQIMCCILYYKKLIIGIHPRTQVRKRLIFYYKTNGITSLKIHVYAYHFFIANMFEKDVNNLSKRIEERQPSKKRMNPFGRSNSTFFGFKNTFKKEDVS